MRLKALTLSGFKSFPNKTTFEFHDGVTCVVGPNGCGKSNLVDAFKWVLGEQSAKSLRGGQMLDVIFSGTAQRRSSGYAEVTLAFTCAADWPGEPDRKDGLYIPAEDVDEAPSPSPEENTITIARKLYRNGESEYLLNNKVARLKDIREMFMDTGVGGYSLIEQGRVEAFLQATSADRREVFDEAAGISRYKARKAEAIRRLERVEQNLLRLTDILSEVAKRLRSIKYQAGKARNYQKYSTRLGELRSLFSLAQYHDLVGRRRDIQADADTLNDALANVTAHMGRLEASQATTETELADLARKSHDLERTISELDGQIIATRQLEQMLSAKVEELTDAIAANTSRCEQLEAKVASNKQDSVVARDHLETVAGEVNELTRCAEAARAASTEAAETVRKLRESLEDEKNGTVDLLRRTAQLHNEINTYSLNRENLHARRQKLTGRSEEIAKSLEDVLSRRSATQTKLSEVRVILTDSQARLEKTQADLGELADDEKHLASDLSVAQQDRSGLVSRRSILEQMQRRGEGLGEGVRRVLAAAKEGNLPSVAGMLGDFVETDVTHAGVIEAALGNAGQWLVASTGRQIAESAGRIRQIAGDADSVEFICLDRIPFPPAGGPSADDRDAPADDSIIARAADLVHCADARITPVIERLLGKTLVVRTLSAAFDLAVRLGGDWRYVTTAGDVLETDGRLRLAAEPAAEGRNKPAGPIWQKSELADVDRKLRENQTRVDELAGRLEKVHFEQKHLEELVHSLRTAVYEANTERVSCQGLLDRLDEQVGELRREAPLVSDEVRRLADEIESAAAGERQSKAGAAELEAARSRREEEVVRLNDELSDAMARQESLASEATAAAVALASARQKHSALRENLHRLDQQGESLSGELTALREQISQTRNRRTEAQNGAAEAQEKIQTSVKQKAELGREMEETTISRETLAERMVEIKKQLADERKEQENLTSQSSDLRVKLGEIEVRIEDLISRTSEELNIDLPGAYSGYTHDEQRDWEAVKAEISELRNKIDRLGNVNLDAIDEQEQLQQREKFLSEQTADIRESQKQLANLIKRINAESRKRFEESFQAVRAHFNELFRKLFGGGKADILLTDPDNVLESGIEIVARPPGKELRSISLMSGGEKTMTALALLFSFFKARPGPFCLLDEVDAALDEQNTGRFTKLVRDFLGTSQFIIITHAKRTIAMADQIYGLTMQQPGVSTPISVRFEDATKMVEPATKTSSKSQPPASVQPVGA
ncbi:MAG: chromosome segregation protein SMC [Planctomycetota bacterium]|nr:chromosome segregation protein SMC [Planctomycetota bacterium]